MKRGVFCFAFVTIFLIMLSRMVYAETPSVARMVFFHAKPGAKAQIEEAIKKQMDWRREQKDDWRWLTWEYVSDEVGRYAVASFGHAWQDFDQPKISPFVEEVFQGDLASLCLTPVVVQYFDHLEEVSALGASKETPTVAELAVFQVQFGKAVQFYEAIRQFHRALQKAGSPERFEWFELLSGGEEPQFMLFLPRRNWAVFDTESGFLPEALEKSVGAKKAGELFARFTATVKNCRRYAVRLALISPACRLPQYSKDKISPAVIIKLGIRHSQAPQPKLKQQIPEP
jgi:hypothetical protein